MIVINPRAGIQAKVINVFCKDGRGLRNVCSGSSMTNKKNEILSAKVRSVLSIKGPSH